MVTIDANPALVLVYNNYHQRPAKRTHESSPLTYLAYASLGVALGAMAGATLGIVTMPHAQPVPTPVVTSGSIPTARVIAQPIHSANPSPVPAAVQAKQGATPQTSTVVKRSHRWFWSARRHRWVRRHGSSFAWRRPVQNPNAVVAIPALAIVKSSSSNEAPQFAAFFTEGDVTVVDFDAAGGKIETYEGRTFAIGAATQPASATSWEDYRANVHYRCDQNGNCTLARKGVVVPNAKLLL